MIPAIPEAVRQLVSTMRHRVLSLAMVLALVAIGSVLAYQAPLHVHLAVGGDPRTQRREDDAPFLRMMHAAEPAVPAVGEWWQLPGADDPYRWTQPESSLLLPGLGGGHWLVTVRAQGGRPDGTPTSSEWQVGSEPPLVLSLPATPARRYTLLVPANGTLQLTFRSTPLQVDGDPRALGFVLRDVWVRPIDTWQMPDWVQLAWVGLILTALWVWGQSIELRSHWIIALLSGSGIIIVAAFALFRLAFALVNPLLAGLILFATIVSVGLAWRWPQHLAWRQAIALTQVALIVRLAGLLHPHAISSDAGFHANNLLRLGLGQVFLTAGLPADAGGGIAPYPVGFYLLALPLQLLVGDDFASRLVLVTVVAAALDSFFCLAIWWWIKQAGFGLRAALFGAACYIGATQAFEALSIGELANVGGQALMLPALIGLFSGASARQSGWLALIGLMLAICAGLLAHSGVTLGFGLLIGWAWVLAWQQPSTVTTPLRLFAAAAGGLGLALMVVYTAPTYLDLIVQRSGQGASGGLAPMQILSDTVLALVGLQPPHRRSLVLPFGLALANLFGLWLLWRSASVEASRLRWLIGAWWAGTLTGLVLLLVADQGLRWGLFLYPALCISAGIALDRLAARSVWGRWLASAGIVTIIGQGVWLWIEQIRDYLH